MSALASIPEGQNQWRGGGITAKEVKIIPGKDFLIQEKSLSSRHHGSAQSPLNNSKAGMLQKLNLVRNSMLCRPDVECSKLEREGQVEGGGARRRREEESKTKDNIFCNLSAESLCSARTLFGDLDKA